MLWCKRLLKLMKVSSIVLICITSATASANKIGVWSARFNTGESLTLRVNKATDEVHLELESHGGRKKCLGHYNFMTTTWFSFQLVCKGKSGVSQIRAEVKSTRSGDSLFDQNHVVPIIFNFGSGNSFEGEMDLHSSYY